MTLATVEGFMTRDPEKVSPTATISDAVGVMAEKNIGSLVVVGNGKAKGVLTERDLLDKVLHLERDPDATRVSDVMSSNIVEVEPSATLKEAAKTMTSRKSRLLVFEKGRPVGIVTATDLVREIHKRGSRFDPSKTVSRKVVTVPAETLVKDVVEIMSKRRVGSVIVTKSGKPHGIFTERDLVKRVLALHQSLETPIQQVATKKLIIARDDMDGKGAAGIMASSRIKRLLFLKGDNMAGVITARDLVEAYAAS